MLIRSAILLSLALMLASPTTAQSDPPERKWIKVPGHPKVFVDMNSIRPMPRYARPCDLTSQKNTKPSCVLTSPDDTKVELWLNGHPAFHLLGCDLPPNVTVSDADGKYYDENEFVGYIPHKAIKGMVCPLRMSKFGKAKTVFPQ
jgi:hypothetical protein